MGKQIKMQQEVFNLRQEMIDVYEALEDEKILVWVNLLKNESKLGHNINYIKESLNDSILDLNTKEGLPTREIFSKWSRDISNLYNLSGLWNKDDYKSWETLSMNGEILFSLRDRNVICLGGRVLEERLIIPEGITGIANNSFHRCKKLKEIILPETLKDIGTIAFFGCEGLEKIKIPRSVENLGGRIFRECPNLETVIVPEKFRKEIEIDVSEALGILPSEIIYY